MSARARVAERAGTGRVVDLGQRDGGLVRRAHDMALIVQIAGSSDIFRSQNRESDWVGELLRKRIVRAVGGLVWVVLLTLDVPQTIKQELVALGLRLSGLQGLVQSVPANLARQSDLATAIAAEDFHHGRTASTCLAPFQVERAVRPAWPFRRRDLGTVGIDAAPKTPQRALEQVGAHRREELPVPFCAREVPHQLVGGQPKLRCRAFQIAAAREIRVQGVQERPQLRARRERCVNSCAVGGLQSGNVERSTRGLNSG